MPTYKYRREDGTTFTIRQKITEDALEKCPETGQPVERVVTGGMGFHLKGGGWYEDGYASTNGSSGQAESTASDQASAEQGGDSNANGKPEAKDNSSQAGESKAEATEAA